MQMRALLLISILSCAQAKIKNKTAAIEAAEDAVSEVAKLCQSVRNETVADAIEKGLDVAADAVNSDFRSQRSGLEDNFSSEVNKTLKEASDSNTTAKLSMSPLREISSKLDALDSHQRHALEKALGHVIEEALKPAHTAFKHSKKVAHDAIHPLYGLGDEAENHADKLNDDLTDALNCVSHANGKLAKLIGDHAKSIEHEAKKSFHQAAHTRQIEIRRVKAALDGAAAPGAMIIDLAVKPTGDSPVAQASGVSLACVAIFVCFVVGATVASGLMKFSPSESTQSTTTPLLRA